VEQWSSLLPFAATVFGYGLVIFVAGRELTPASQGVLISAVLLTGFVLGRQFVTARENARLNAELRSFAAELERRVDERTAQLQQSQAALLTSQRLVSVGALAAGIVHEVNTPLSAIAAASESLETQLKTGELDQAALESLVPIINQSAWHASRIVQTLRGYARRSQPALAPEELTGVAQDALLLLKHQAQRWGNVKIVTDFSPTGVIVLCDRNQIIQVLINLVTNAREAMPAGGAITARVRATTTHGLIEVSDQGAGITSENRGKIFEPFFSTKGLDEQSGLGLGLSIVADIVRAHNGVITVHSDGPGQGATFTVALPLAV
jgi:signal transduction histidine kinase